jgi:flagellar biosynthesis/type III secretory pathway chaperone
MTAIDQLNDVLHREAALADDLLAAMQDLQRAVVEFRADALRAAVEREATALRPLQQAEGERLALIRALLPGTGGTGAPPATLSRVVETVPQEEGDRLRAAGERLQEIARRIQEMNHRNRLLLEHSAAFIRTTLRAVTEGYARQLIDHRV